MKKYLALVRVEEVTLSGFSMNLHSMFSNRKNNLYDWILLFKSSETRKVTSIIINNTPQLNEFFKYYESFIPFYNSDAGTIYQKILNENNS